MSSKKILIMPSPEERERFERSEGRGASQATTSGAALPAGYLDDVAKVAAIYQTLGGLEKLVDGLGATTKSHAEKIEQLTQRVYAIPTLEKDVAQNTKDLNELGRRLEKDMNELGRRQTKDLNELGIRLGNNIGALQNTAHTADKLFRIFIGALAVILTVLGPPLMIYLYHHVKLIFQP